MELNFKSFGQGPPLIILHGLFGTLDNWQTLGRRWADHYTVFLVDQRNHGRSPKVDHMDYPSMAEDLKEFLEHHWVYHAHLLGHSMGGKTVMEFALHYPDMVDRLVVVDIGIRANPNRHGSIFKALFDLDLTSLKDRKAAEAALAPEIEDRSIRQFLLKNLVRTKERGYEWKMNLPVLYRDYTNILAPIESSTPYEKEALFIRGGKSSYVTDDDWPAIQAVFPRAQLATVAEAGHWVHADAPQQLSELVLGFLNN